MTDVLSALSVMVLAGACVALALRMVRMGEDLARLRKERDESEESRRSLAVTASNVSREAADRQRRHDAEVASLRAELKALEEELHAVSGPGDRHRRVQRLLDTPAAPPTDPDRGPPDPSGV